MASSIRVYELARELGLTNKETLDLCDALGIGVKSHSSSVVEAQADRVRRKAEREGLIRDTQPEEPEAEKPVSKTAKANTKDSKAAKTKAAQEAKKKKSSWGIFDFLRPSDDDEKTETTVTKGQDDTGPPAEQK